MLDALLTSLQEQLAAQSLAESVAVVLALAYVWLAARQNIWCWPCALVSTGIYTWLFWEVTLPFNAALNAYYLLMAVYGWYCWKGSEVDTVPVVQWSWQRHTAAIPVLFVTSLLLAHLAGPWLGGEDLYLDAMVTVFSVFTTYLVARKVLENWQYWMVINLFAAYLYFSNGLVLTGVLFLGYIGMSVYGYFHWRADLSGTKSEVPQTAGQ